MTGLILSVLIMVALWAIAVPVEIILKKATGDWDGESFLYRDIAIFALPVIILTTYCWVCIATAEPEQPEREVQYKPSAEQVKLILSPPVTEEVQAERDEIKARLLQRAKEVVAERNAKLSQ
jgi:hypothetical protein